MHEIMEIRQQVRLNQWSAMVQQREDSGLSVKAFCKQAGIATKTYYYRLRRLREAAIKKTQMGTLQPTTSQPELVQYTPPTGYVTEPAPQNIVIKTADTTVDDEYKSGSCRSRGILFEAAMIDLSSIKKYYIACGYTDLRRGIDGLAQIVTLQYGYEINENSLFLFCGRRTDRIKALWFSGDGFVLLYKRLNNGHFQWPRSKDEMKLLTPQSFRWLMEGLSVEQKKVIKKVRNKDMFKDMF